VNAVIPDAPDDRPFRHFEYDDLAIWLGWRLLHAQFHVFKELRVPQRLEIPPQCLFVVGITVAAEDARFQCVGSNAAVPNELDPVNHKIPTGQRGSSRLFGCKIVNFFGEGIDIQVGVKKVMLVLGACFFF
jgi:hypothetical protein